MKLTTWFSLLTSFFFLTAASAAPAYKLDLHSAGEAALKSNLLTLLAQAKSGAAKGRVLQAASRLLPHILLNLQQSRVYKENLASMGFSSFGVIGPYNSFDGRIQLVEDIFDLSALDGFRAEEVNNDIAGLDEELAAKQVRSAVSLAYLEAVSAQEELKAAKADLSLAKQLLKLSRHQNLAGLATGINVARFETREAEDEARCLQALMNWRKACIELNRIVGLPLDTRLELMDTLKFMSEDIFSVDAEINLAVHNRTELKIAAQRIKYRGFKVDEASAQRLPTIGLSGDYGLGGDRPNGSLRSVGEMGVVLKMPIFDGRAIDGDVEEAKSNVHQAKLTFDDMNRQVEEDVRLAQQALSISVKQLKADRKVFALAARELAMSRDLFAADIGDNLEVANAQTTLARARQQYVAALFQYNAARVNFYSALGDIEGFSLIAKNRR